MFVGLRAGSLWLGIGHCQCEPKQLAILEEYYRLNTPNMCAYYYGKY